MAQTLIGTNFTAATFATATSTFPVQGGGTGFTVGSRAAAHNGKEYVFVQSNSAVSAFDVVTIPTDTYVAATFSTTVAAASEMIGVAQFALASGEYGWVQTYGACKVKVLGLAAKSVTLYSTTTGGTLDDATGSNYQVTGIQILSTNPSSTATAMSAFISYPKVRILPGVA
jgi:hypothetical protein